jgi:hypothetical protein
MFSLAFKLLIFHQQIGRGYCRGYFFIENGQ